MTREEEIIGESYKIFPLNSDKRQAFIRGAKYADQNPAPNLVDIDKACEAFCKCECEGWCEVRDSCKLIQKFKQAMKGE